ncbi:MAG: type II toxin-antitoxin system VapC family toxin [Planctomycetaceae bacterium]
MSLYLFDTDLLTLYSKGHSCVCERASAHQSHELVTSVLTVEELLTGWYTVLRQAKNDQQLAVAYDGMTFSIEFLSQMRVISFSAKAAARFTVFRKARLKIKTMDLRIACVALEAGAKLVTRNRADFELVPGLELEDWTIP